MSGPLPITIAYYSHRQEALASSHCSRHTCPSPSYNQDTLQWEGGGCWACLCSKLLLATQLKLVLKLDICIAILRFAQSDPLFYGSTWNFHIMLEFKHWLSFDIGASSMDDENMFFYAYTPTATFMEIVCWGGLWGALMRCCCWQRTADLNSAVPFISLPIEYMYIDYNF